MRVRFLKPTLGGKEGKCPMIKVLQGCILKLLLHSVNSVLILYRTGVMQSAILLSFAISSSLPLCGFHSTHLPIPRYISPYIVYNVYAEYPLFMKLMISQGLNERAKLKSFALPKIFVIRLLKFMELEMT